MKNFNAKQIIFEEMDFWMADVIKTCQRLRHQRRPTRVTILRRQNRRAEGVILWRMRLNAVLLQICIQMMIMYGNQLSISRQFYWALLWTKRRAHNSVPVAAARTVEVSHENSILNDPTRNFWENWFKIVQIRKISECVIFSCRKKLLQLRRIIEHLTDRFLLQLISIYLYFHKIKSSTLTSLSFFQII